MQADAGDEPSKADRARARCVAGWGYFLIGSGLMIVLPGTVLFGITVGDMSPEGHKNWTQTAGVVIFSVSIFLLLAGLGCLLHWCLKYDQPTARVGKRQNCSKNNGSVEPALNHSADTQTDVATTSKKHADNSRIMETNAESNA